MINLVVLAKSSAAVAVALAGLTGSGAVRDALWHVVNGLCVNNQKLTTNPAPCSSVDTARGFAVLWTGAAHYLLVPTVRIAGIESSELLQPAAPNYWDFAWQSRKFLDDAVGKAVPRSVVGMAINSAQARTQDQLHIHIGCIRRDVLKAMQRYEAKAGPAPSAHPVVLAQRAYTVVRIQGESLEKVDPFKVVAENSAIASSDMASESIAVMGATFANGRDGFYLLSRRSAANDGAAAEHLLDYKCKAVTAPR